ncbi:sulfite exporter TauE/SafE family protein [Geodermatophilus sp. YIM 151500]|uniref:sulfite exporter TauE/SafE family protein n=1 Tax=Geodermatophilus sp. YIM 151500 TaxID=2984531 RepID=UPI0021E4F7F5|nr:sulfite exporter TauE/SafE family protein [Geodermatophilus sp. YIM 151500]MCV2491510.1 sulfite exporter TauE/SafE family protein [Geodermatophilus sp. YIM 151500]
MSALDFGFLVLAGVGAGLTGSIAGLASLISYPALLVTGVPPVTANMTNTVALSLLSASSVSASRPELAGQRRRLLRLGLAGLLGGGVGAALLMLTPSAAFEKVVPALIGAAALVLLVSRPPAELAAEGVREQRVHPHRDPSWLPLGTFVVSIYGGYFGAAAGVVMVAMYLLTTGEGLPRGNALRNAVLGCANAVAALGFLLFGTVVWSAALPLAIGLFAGGLLGPPIVRRAPQALLRRLIALAGLGLAVHLAVQAYT